MLFDFLYLVILQLHNVSVNIHIPYCCYDLGKICTYNILLTEKGVVIKYDLRFEVKL